MSALSAPRPSVLRRAGRGLDPAQLAKLEGVYERHGRAVRLAGRVPEDLRWLLLEYVLVGNEQLEARLPHGSRRSR